VAEYNSYCEEDWEDGRFPKHYTSPTGNMFGADKEAGGCYKKVLQKLGAWHCEILTSSIAAERTFGVMRDVEASKMLSMTSILQWRTEVMLTVNKWVVQSDFSAVLERRKRPTQEGSFFRAASSLSSSSPPAVEVDNAFGDYLE